MKRVTILGATGSIGRSCADVLLAHHERFKTAAVTACRDATGLAELAIRLNADFAALAEEGQGGPLREALAGTGIASGAGYSAMCEAAERDSDIVVAAISGAAGLEPVWHSLKAGRVLALANKEALVCAGEIVMARAAQLGVAVHPVDSEHNALLQALSAGRVEDAERLVLTASGGPFRTWDKARIAMARAKDALEHPTWTMGAKISIDSATLMNKGLELIEAYHLFGIEKLEVLVHPQSVVHGLVYWRDGSVTAGLAAPDMRIPIAEALSCHERLEMKIPRLDLAKIGALSFEEPDEDRFPCLALARQALSHGGAAPCLLNAANEVAVKCYLEGSLTFYEISALVEKVLSSETHHWPSAPRSIEEALAMDEAGRRAVRA